MPSGRPERAEARRAPPGAAAAADPAPRGTQPRSARKYPSARVHAAPSASGRVRHRRGPRAATAITPDCTSLRAVLGSIPAFIALIVRFPFR